MMTPRQIETVLRVRRHRRDQIRALMGQILSDGRTLSARLENIEADRAETLAALRAITGGGSLDVDRSAALRYHAGRLSIELMQLATARSAHEERLTAVRAALAKADRDVKAVERLRERQLEVERRTTERKDDREATDRFAAMTSSREPMIDEDE